MSFVGDTSKFETFMSSSTMAIRTSGATFEATFRGVEKANFIHDYVLFKIV